MLKELKNILIVDDDYVSTWITKDAIESLQPTAKIHMVYDGSQALDFLSENCLSSKHPACNFCPAIIFLDLNMPVLDGFEFLEEFKKKYTNIDHEIIIYILTTSSHTKDLEKSELFNVDGFIRKPLTEETIIEVFKKQS